MSPEVYWTMIGALATCASVIALAFTVWYAHGLIETTRKTSKITLTNEVLNSDWLNKAATNFNLLVASLGSYERLRNSLAVAAPNEFEIANSETLNAAFAAGLYVARLYSLDVLDRKMVLDTSCEAFGLAFYAMQNRMMRNFDMGLVRTSDFNLARDCRERLKQLPAPPYFKELLRKWDDIPGD
jgi:hypothetical protein